jgi:prepilin-type N-terminal cleavage/methylation domain-containing protein
LHPKTSDVRRDAGDSDRGFTLLEVVVALAVLGLIVVTVGRLTDVAVASVLDARDQSVAVLAAASKLEELAASRDGVVALGISPPAALEQDVAGFADRVGADGRPIPAGAAAGRAVFVRRWSLGPLGENPSRGRIVRVRVMGPRVRAAQPSSLAADVLLVTIFGG